MRLANSQFTRMRLLPSKHLSWLLMALCLLFIAGCSIPPKQDLVPELASPRPVQVTTPQPDTPLGHFIEQIAPLAQAEQRESGVPASFSIAQAIHESWKYETNSPSLLARDYNNYHGIRCSEPKELPCEQVRNATTGNMDSWNSYSSAANGFLYHGRWLRQNSNYSDAFNYTNDPLAFAREVLRCYTGCEAPFPQSYYDDIVRLINDYNLRQYDVGSPLVLAPQPSVPPIIATIVPATVSPATPAIPTNLPMATPTHLPPTPTPPGGGGKIAYVGTDRNLWIMNVDGSDPKRLTTLGKSVYHPRWFPDGNRLIFTTHGDTYIVNADGSGLTRMPYDYEPAPSISPDGRKLAGTFEQTRPYQGGRAFVTSDLIVSDIDGSNRISLTGCSESKLCSFWGTTWSPDGQWIAFGGVFIDSPPAGGIDIYVIRADGSDMKRLTFMENALAPSWSPDGRKIAFVSSSPPQHLYVMNSDGSNISKLPFADVLPHGSLTWSPDGTKLAVSDTSHTIYIMNADGSQLLAIGSGSEPAWSPR